MKFSIITPEHNSHNPYLYELYESLCAQTYQQWEWILYLNNGCKKENINLQIINDNRVKITEAGTFESNIGAIKHHAFHLGTGDILVELDHDDLLTPECLNELFNVYEKNHDVGFVYSDCAILHMTEDFTPYNEANGWTYTKFNWKGKDLITMRSFQPTSHSLSFIWFAPDHVRSWRKDVYHKVGGHNSKLSVCDDHELMIRTYLNTKMCHIPKTLYIYRITGENTWIQRNAEIQSKTVELFYQYARDLAEKDAKDRGLLCIDLGGGLYPYKDYLVVDSRNTADIKCDLNEGIPLPDNSVGVINASHIIEHLHDKTKTMKEIHRVLTHGGWAFIEVPSTDGRGAFQDPTHVSYWNENSFLYYTDSYLAQFIDNTDIRFQEYRRETFFPNEHLKNMNVNVVAAWLIAIKDNTPRFPGELKI